jgi:hypothetical protein
VRPVIPSAPTLRPLLPGQCPAVALPGSALCGRRGPKKVVTQPSRIARCSVGRDYSTCGLNLVAACAPRRHAPSAELHRVKRELLLQSHDQSLVVRRTAAEGCFQKALAVARRPAAKSWELRVATRLARLWQHQDRKAEARQLLAEIYPWFTEGFDTKDLQEAKALLEELTCSATRHPRADCYWSLFPHYWTRPHSRVRLRCGSVSFPAPLAMLLRTRASVRKSP